MGECLLLLQDNRGGQDDFEDLGGYVEHIRKLHPGAPLPAVYVADGILDDARIKRGDLSDDVFFRVLSEGEVSDEWGEYGAGWDAGRWHTYRAENEPRFDAVAEQAFRK